MIMQDVYYFCKPIIPRWFQIQLRRAIVSMKKKKYIDVWPIDRKTKEPG